MPGEPKASARSRTPALPSEPLPPSSAGVITRLALAHAAKAGLEVAPLLARSGLTLAQAEDRHARIGVANQVTLLGLLAEVLGDDLLGFHLGESFELREAGLLYYVMASAPTLWDALARAERYGTITNEGIVPACAREDDVRLRFTYVGVPRHADRHQAEFWMTGVIRLARQLTGAGLRPVRVALAHPRRPTSDRLEALFGCPTAFGSREDMVAFALGAGDLPLPGADPYLHDLLLGYCEEALAHRGRPAESLRTRIENTVASLLPHGRPLVDDVARSLGMSQRTLSRRLAQEGLTFARILDEMRRDLAQHYLRDDRLPVSRIAWLLGFQEVGAFTHAFRRWTGRTPTEARSPAGEAERGGLSR